MKELRRLIVIGDDGQSYTIVKLEEMGKKREIDGISVTLQGKRHFELEDGTSLIDDASGYWEVPGSGVRLRKPDDL